MKAIKAITIGTSALALIPAVLAAEKGLISQGVETLFGAATGGGIFVKLGLFIILFSFLMLGAKKVFPADHSKVGMLVAAILALIGMKFMPEMWVTGLGTLIWVAALALLPYAIVSIFIKEDVDKDGKISKKKIIFTLLAYAVLLFAVMQMKGTRVSNWMSSMGLRGEFWEDMSYRFGWIQQYFWVLLIAIAVVLFFIWLLTRKGDKGGDAGDGPKGDKGKSWWQRRKERNAAEKERKHQEKLKEIKEKEKESWWKRGLKGIKEGYLYRGLKGLGKGLLGGTKGVGKGIGWAGKKFGRGVKKVAPGLANGVAKGAKGLGKGAKWLGGKAKNGVGGIRNKLARRKGRKAGEEFRAKELEYDAEQKLIQEEKEAALRKAKEEGTLKGEEFKRLEREYDERQKRIIEERDALRKAAEEGRLRGEEFKLREKAQEEGRLRGEEFKQKERLAEEEQRRLKAHDFSKLSREELIRKYNEINEHPIDIHDFDKHILREKLWKELQNRERILAEEMRIAEQRSLADKIKESGRNVLEKMHLVPAHAGPSAEHAVDIERKQRIESERIRIEEAKMRERGASEAEIEKFKRLAMEKHERELDILVKRQREEEAGVIRKHEEEYSHKERERELKGQKAAEEHVGWLERIGLRRRETEEQRMLRLEHEKETARVREEELLVNKRRQEEEMFRERETQQRVEKKELSQVEKEERRIAMEEEREVMRKEIAEKVARHAKEMAQEAKIKREAERQREQAEEKARKAKLEAEREQMARQRRRSHKKKRRKSIAE